LTDSERSREHGATGRGRTLDGGDPENAPIPRRTEGDPETLVGVDNPDDVDLYRHGAPPPGFRHATVRRPRPEDPAERALREGNEGKKKEEDAPRH